MVPLRDGTRRDEMPKNITLTADQRINKFSQ